MRSPFFSTWRACVLAGMFAAWLSGPCPARASDLPAGIAQALATAQVPEASVGLWVQALDAPEPALTLNPDQAFNPASVMKLLTTVVALDRLGPAHRWYTGVRVEGEVRDGTLHGNLYLIGGGDPGLTQSRFNELLREVMALGIRHISGDVVIDNDLYALPPIDPAEFDQAPLKPYNAAPTALLVNYNALTLRLAEGLERPAVWLDPPALGIDNQLTQDASAPTCADWRDRIEIERVEDRLRLSGTYPAACGHRQLWLNLMCPPATVSVMFRSLWRALGGTLTGDIRVGFTPDSARHWLDFESLPLAELVRDINKYSNNVMAKMLFLNLGIAQAGAPGSWEKGAAAIRAWLAEHGFDWPELVIENGAGLSRSARLTPRQMATLLRWASRVPLYYEFAAALPALGQEGTQRLRMPDSPLAGRAWLKSGTLNGVRNLAGYLITPEGQRRLVVAFINDPQAGAAAAVQEAILTWAGGLSGVPAAAAAKIVTNSP